MPIDKGEESLVRPLVRPKNQLEYAPSATRTALSAKLSNFGAKKRQVDDILAGLPARVMDELVVDLAEAVVAMLEQPTAAEPGDGDDASSSL